MRNRSTKTERKDPTAWAAGLLQAIVSGLRRSSISRLRSSRAVPDAGPRALAIVGPGPGWDALQAVFRDIGWELAVVDTYAAAIVRQEAEPLPVVLYGRELRERYWPKDVFLLSRHSPRPCVILLSDSADENLWSEFVQCGGFDILRTPIDRDAVKRVVGAAWCLWRNQQKLRWLEAETRS